LRKAATLGASSDPAPRIGSCQDASSRKDVWSLRGGGLRRGSVWARLPRSGGESEPATGEGIVRDRRVEGTGELEPPVEEVSMRGGRCDLSNLGLVQIGRRAPVGESVMVEWRRIACPIPSAATRETSKFPKVLPPALELRLSRPPSGMSIFV